MISSIIEADKCTGCAACVNICEWKAVKMVCKNNGFPYPVIDGKMCSECMQCIKVCRMRNDVPGDSLVSPVVYAMRSENRETRIHSTSGGIFSELAECILRKKGTVTGAVYASDWSVEHRMIQDLEELESLRRSKYQQSHIQLVYQEIKAALNEHKDVLFCGTPCQAGGLRAFLGKEYGNLIICDFICRGVSSPKIFFKYTEDLKHIYGSEIKDVWMKNKYNGWHSLTTVIGFENGQEYVKRGLEDSYVQLYLKYNMGVRESCYECNFKGQNDVADITLGDFWGLEGTELDDDLGTSVVICRTQKGHRIVDEIKSHVQYQYKQMEEVEKGNPCLCSSIRRSVSETDTFYDILEREGYRQAVSWIANTMQ